MNIEKLKKLIIENSIEWRKHTLQKMFERNISRKDVKETIEKGEMIAEYEHDKPFPSALFFKFVRSRPLHVVVSLDEKQDKTYIITTYEPTLDIFEIDYKTRKMK